MLHALFEIYRRSLWLLTVVLALSIVTFALAPAPTLSHNLPKFINAQPKRLNDYAWSLAQHVANNEVDAAQAATELARLGAVALPHVLPKLDSLPPEGRGRVLQALQPVAVRMGLAQAQGNVAQLSGTWLTFLSDNSVYLHPAMAKRIVERFVADPSAQHARDLRRLDTFALGELLQRLHTSGKPETTEVHVSKVIEVLRQITGHDATWSLPPPSAAHDEWSKLIVEKWKTWWFAERPLYEPTTATSHLTAPLLQTEFALWVRGGLGAWFDRGASAPLGAVPWLALLRSACLFIFAVFGGNVLTRMAPASAARTRAVLGGVGAAVGWLPAALFAVWAHETGIEGLWVAVPVVIIFGAALTMRSYPQASNPQAPILNQPTNGASYTASLLGMCLLLEWGLRLDGLGPILISAIKRADATPVLCVALVNTMLIGIVQYLGPRLTSKAL